MNKSKGRGARIFLFTIGLIMVLAGTFMVYADRIKFMDALVNNLAFFLTGGILIYFGLTYKKNKQ